MRTLRSAAAAVVALAAAAPVQAADGPVVADAQLALPGVIAPGGRVAVAVAGMPVPLRIQERRGTTWVDRGEPIFDARATTTFRAPPRSGRLQLRARAQDGRITRSAYVRLRALRMAAVGDINLGDGPGAAIDRFGASYPWSNVGARLRGADLTFGNLECAVSVRGSAQPKTFTFRGRPSALRAMREQAGFDVVNLANNHAGDFGDRALLDTLRHLRDNGIAAVGAGATAASAYRPLVVERLGLRIAFVGFSDIGPFDFHATARGPGTAWAFPKRVAAGVRRAGGMADVVIATFHWGIERDFAESARQRSLARIALTAGATAVIGAHPHVLQPIRRPAPRRLIAYSLGNFVFAANSAGTERTGILELNLNARGVTRARLRDARIVATRPILRRP